MGSRSRSIPPPPSLQAVEAKEGLEIQNESVTLASVSYQAFFRGFPKLAGGTRADVWIYVCGGGNKQPGLPRGFLGGLRGARRGIPPRCIANGAKRSDDAGQ